MVTVSLASVLASTLLALASASALPEPQFQFGPFLIHSVARPRHHHTQQRHYTSRHKRQRPRLLLFMTSGNPKISAEIDLI